MKNLPIILNIILFALVGHLYYLNSKSAKPAEGQSITPPASQAAGARIAYVNADTLDAKYEWFKTQKAAIEQRITTLRKSLGNKEQALMEDAAALREKFEQGNMTQAEAEKQQKALMQRGENLEAEKERLSNSLGEEQKKANDELYANLENNLKTISSKIGYDYILSYSRGGLIMLANDSLDITTQVLELLNAKK